MFKKYFFFLFFYKCFFLIYLIPLKLNIGDQFSLCKMVVYLKLVFLKRFTIFIHTNIRLIFILKT